MPAHPLLNAGPQRIPSSSGVCGPAFQHLVGRTTPLGSSGYVDWHRLDRTLPWIKVNNHHHTYVYAFWLVDYRQPVDDHGVDLLKPEGKQHPDWFVHADTADRVLAAYTTPDTIVSPNFTQVFATDLSSRPLLASMLFGTADAMYMRGSAGQAWWCDPTDLTWRGKLLLKQMDRLYERPSVLVTFLDKPTDENTGPRDPE